MKMPLVIALSLICAQATAQTQYSQKPPTSAQKTPPQLLGIWGTAEQCVAHREGINDNPRLFPYRISTDWVQQGNIYCYLSWQEPEQTDDGMRVYAFAQCGEDNLREYRLMLQLEQGRLRIRWSEDFTTRALEAC